MTESRWGLRVSIALLAAGAACVVGAGIAVALVPGGVCLIGPRTPSAASQDAMWSTLGATGVFALAGFWVAANLEQRARRMLWAVGVLEIAVGVAILVHFGHHTAHWSDCG